MSLFVILTNPRNGSTWFADVLNRVPDVDCHDELLVKTRYRYPRSYLNSEEYRRRVAIRPHWEYYKKRQKIGFFAPGAFFRYLDEKLTQKPHGGFKLMFKQMLRHPFSFIYLLARGGRIIRLKRRNYLDIALSFKTMEERNRGHTTSPVDQIRVSLPPDETLAAIKRYERWDMLTDFFCRIVPLPVCEVVYEDLMEDPDQWQNIIAFVTGARPASTPQSKYTKSNTATQAAMITNYQDLKNKLKSNGYNYLLR